ncbi:hypothetical protein [Terrisporobacter sp.]
MTLKIPIIHSCDIKCPKCNHTYLYEFKIEDLERDNYESEYEFLTYLICKNPLCNYDIKIKGKVIDNSSDSINSLKITSIK